MCLFCFPHALIAACIDVALMKKCVPALLFPAYLFWCACVCVCVCVRVRVRTLGTEQCLENQPFGNNGSIIENPLFHLPRTGCPGCNVISAITVATEQQVNKVEEGEEEEVEGERLSGRNAHKRQG